MCDKMMMMMQHERSVTTEQRSKCPVRREDLERTCPRVPCRRERWARVFGARGSDSGGERPRLVEWSSACVGGGSGDARELAQRGERRKRAGVGGTAARRHRTVEELWGGRARRLQGPL